MAVISEILTEIWPGSQWSITEDDYSTLVWNQTNSVAKPLESEIRSHSDAVDATISDRRQRGRQQAGLVDSTDYLLKVIETFIDALIEIRRVINTDRSTIVAQAHTGSFTPWDTNVIARLSAIKQKVDNLRNIP